MFPILKTHHKEFMIMAGGWRYWIARSTLQAALPLPSVNKHLQTFGRNVLVLLCVGAESESEWLELSRGGSDGWTMQVPKCWVGCRT